MAFFKVNWTLDGTIAGVEKAVHHAGDVLEAELKDVEHLVAATFGGLVGRAENAVLSPASPDEATAAALQAATGDGEGETTIPGGDVDLSKLTKADLVAHADEHHDLDIPAAATKPEIIATIEQARVAAAAAVTGEAPVNGAQ